VNNKNNNNKIWKGR